MSYPKHLLMLRLYTRPELPAWSRLLRLAGVMDNARWAGAPVVTVRGKWHGLNMVLDLRSQGDRLCYFIARYADIPSQRLVRALLAPGDTFIDVGANTGMVTLVGAGAVGPTGRVHAFEPNPSVFARMDRTVRANDLGAAVTTHNAGLSDTPATLALRVPVENPDMGTFGSGLLEEYKSLPTMEVRCEVAVGDERLGSLPERDTVIKIDVEGFECAVLRGLARTIDRLRPAVLTEVEPQLLRQAGASPGEVAAFFASRGYEGYWMHLWQTRPVSFLHRTRLERMTGSIDENRSQNVLWIHPASVHRARIASFVK